MKYRRFRSFLGYVARALSASFLITLGACATSFEGSARYPGGPQACYQSCRASGMEMASFVYVGEYSTACACKPRPTPGVASAAYSADEGAVVAATAGVEMQRRRAEQQQRQPQQKY